MSIIYVVFLVVAGIVAAIAATAVYLKSNATSRSNLILKEAEEKAEMARKEKVFQAKEEILQLKMKHEQEAIEKNNRLSQLENRLKQHEIGRASCRERV